eukprot:m.1114383 g.1114383  ORF g.1114383 m.1114383 type:complete len:175 (+) comp24366_c0_seq22:3441-3965(+)
MLNRIIVVWHVSTNNATMHFVLGVCCRHAFCAACFTSLYSRQHGQLKCPICRARVSLILGRPVYHAPDTTVRAVLQSYNERYSGAPRGWCEMFRESPVMIRERVQAMTLVETIRVLLTLRTAATLVFAVMYILSPIDLIPDVLGPLGLVDDVGVFLFTQVFISEVFRNAFLNDG